MDQRHFQSKVLPHIIAVAIFLVISMVFFYPLLQGKILVQGDISNYKAMAEKIWEHREQHGDLSLIHI